MDRTRRHPAKRARLLGALTLGLLLAALAPGPVAQARVPADFFGMSVVQPRGIDFEGMAELGAGSYRVELGWPGMQAERDGPYNFVRADSRIRAAAAAGMEILPILFGTPAFLTGDPDHIRGPTSRREKREWQEFVVAVIDRYRRGGEFWAANPGLDQGLAPTKMILWNEQNARSFWWPRAKPKQYAALVRKTRSALDRIDPDLGLITGGMFGYPSHPNSINAKRFLRKVYAQRGVRRSIDGVSVHPYAGGIDGVKKQVRNARKVMRKAGDGAAEIVIGETGWASGGNPRSPLVKSKRGQKRMLKRAYGLFLQKRRRWNIDSAHWFTYRDYRSDSFCLWCSKAGLRNRAGRTKPAGKAYRKLVRRKTR